jgi:predicted transcriptional regulator
MNVSKELKKSIKDKGLTFRHVSKATAIPYDTLLSYTSGRTLIPVCKLIFICEKFEIDKKIFGQYVSNIEHPKAS